MSGQNGQNGVEDDAGKLFVGGINRNTSDESFRNYFSKFGTIQDCVLMRDKATGVSRGFGFITYTDPMSLNEVLKERPHTLDNKVIDAKPCTPKHMQPQKKQYANQYPSTKKIFLGGISMEATEDDVKSYMSRYGVVVEVHFVSDKSDATRPHKGFGFITFEDESSVDQAIAKHYHIIKDKRCEAKSAEQKDRNGGQGAGNPYDQNQMGGYQNMQMGYGAQGGQWNGANMIQAGYGGYGNGYGTYQAQGYGQQQGYGQPGANGAQGGYGGAQAQQAYGGYAGYGYGNMYGQQQAVPGGAPGQQQYGGGNPTSTAASGGAGGYQNPGKGYHPYKR